jgi:hypothetical protein
MKHGCTCTILKQRLNCHSGWENSRRDQKSTSESIKCEGVVDRFFYGRGVVHHEFVPRGQTVNGQFYLEVMKRLREAEQRKRPEACSHIAPHPWIFGEARDDCCPPTALLTRFVPCALFFVPKVDIHSERSPISDDRRARRKFATGPVRYPAKRVPELEKTLERCIDSGGEYFEGDKSY